MIVLRRVISPLASLFIKRPYLTTPVYQSFAFMQLFQANKKPEELSPVFKKPTRIKGHLKSKSRKGYISPKLNMRTGVTQQRLKNHKGLFKRVKIVGPRWNRQFKRLHAQRRHLLRHKSRNNLQRKKRAAYISQADIWRVKRMLPYFKRQSLKRKS